MRTNPSWAPGNLENSGKLREGDIIDRNNWAQVLRETPDKVVDMRLHRLNQIYKNYKQDGKTDYNTSLQFVKEAYSFKPLDPYNPARPFPRELRNAVGMILGLQEKSQMMRIKFYSALDSPLDKHGGDAVIEYDDPEVGPIDITLDETMNPEKIEDGHNADIIMHDVVAAPDKDKDKFLHSVATWAVEVVKKIKEKKEEIIQKQRRTLH